jgi:uncharacterized protein DUF6328
MQSEIVDTSALTSPRGHRGGAAALVRPPPAPSTEVVSLKEEARLAHEEARTVLPGIQALFGFQLIAVFNRPFFDLERSDQLVHLSALVLVALAVGLIMAPAAHHRLAEPGIVSRHWIELASRDIASAMGALAVAIGLDVYLVAVVISARTGVSVAVGAAVAAVLAWLWFVLPLVRGRRRMRPACGGG